jgi:hypothetical protein
MLSTPTYTEPVALTSCFTFFNIRANQLVFLVSFFELVAINSLSTIKFQILRCNMSLVFKKSSREIFYLCMVWK